MEKTNEIYPVPKCPSCGKAHQYPMTVMRSSVLFGARDKDAPAEKGIRRIFICPKTKAKFEVVVILKDDPDNPIASVRFEEAIAEDEK